MKYAFFETKEDAETSMKEIEDAVGITEGRYGFPPNIIKQYRVIEEIDGRWGFSVADSDEGKADHLVDTEEYEPEEDDG